MLWDEMTGKFYPTEPHFKIIIANSTGVNLQSTEHFYKWEDIKEEHNTNLYWPLSIFQALSDWIPQFILS